MDIVQGMFPPENNEKSLSTSGVTHTSTQDTYTPSYNITV